jgi:hypothetical protein
MLDFAVPIISSSKTRKNAGSKPHFAEPNWHILTFLHPIKVQISVMSVYGLGFTLFGSV